MFNPVGGKKYVLHGPVDDLLCQCASLSSRGTVCTEVRAHFINVSSVFYFCGIHNNVLCTNKQTLKCRWNSWFVGSAGEKNRSRVSHSHTRDTISHQMSLGTSHQVQSEASMIFSTALASVEVTVFLQCEAGWKSGCLQREVRDSQWRCDAAGRTIFFFMCSFTDSLFSVWDKLPCLLFLPLPLFVLCW